MATVKGILLGAAIFVGVVVLDLFAVMRRLQSHFNSVPSPSQREVGWDLVTLYHNMGFPLWLLLCFPVCLIIGCLIVARRHSRGVPVP